MSSILRSAEDSARVANEAAQEIQVLLGAQRVCVGDDTHFYRKSLVEFHQYLARSAGSHADSVGVVDNYLIAMAADDLTVRDRASIRWRRIIGSKVDTRSTPAQIAAAWTCFAAGFKVRK